MSWLMVGISFVLGVLLWPLWCPSFTSLLAVLAIIIVALLMVRSQSTTRMLVGLMCFLLASLRCSVIIAQELPQQGSFFGEVVWREGRIAVVEKSSERAVFAFPGTVVPRLGSFVALRYASRTPPIELGGYSSLLVARRFGASFRAVTSFETNATETAPPERLNWLTNGPVLWAFISGQRAAIQPDLKALLRRTGTSHLLAISGLHVGIVAATAWWVARLLCLPLIVWHTGLAVELISSVAASTTAIF